MNIEPRVRERLLELFEAGVRREYPHKPGGVFTCDDDWKPPRHSTPLFYGCFDWHSAVHTHWALARLKPEALRGLFTADGVRAEVRYLANNPGFEIPYGMAWLILLCDELDVEVLAPLQHAAIQRMGRWLEKLTLPIRSGEHPNSAFAMAMAHDYAPPLRDLINRKARDFYLADRHGPIGYEPSAYDFLSPCLAEADLMRRVMTLDEWEKWLHGFLPEINLQPVITVDRAEGKLAHFDGLNLSRAWMLRNIAMTLDDARLKDLAEAHAEEGLKGIWSDRWEVTHWLGSFAVYWLTESFL